MIWDTAAPERQGAVLEYTRELEKFLADIERRAFRMAQVALRDPDDALDVVQDAMLKLTRNYASKPSGEWRPLFYRILENGIRDLQRRRSVRKRIMTWLPGPKEDPDNEAADPLDNVADQATPIPETLMQAQALDKLETSLRVLPARQREALVLQYYQELPNIEAAALMGISVEALESLLSRARRTLRGRLAGERGEHVFGKERR